MPRKQSARSESEGVGFETSFFLENLLVVVDPTHWSTKPVVQVRFLARRPNTFVLTESGPSLRSSFSGFDSRRRCPPEASTSRFRSIIAAWGRSHPASFIRSRRWCDSSRCIQVVRSTRAHTHSTRPTVGHQPVTLSVLGSIPKSPPTLETLGRPISVPVV